MLHVLVQIHYVCLPRLCEEDDINQQVRSSRSKLLLYYISSLILKAYSVLNIHKNSPNFLFLLDITLEVYSLFDSWVA